MFNQKWLISMIIVLALSLAACTPNSSKRPSPYSINQHTNINHRAVKYEDIKVSPKEAFNTFTRRHPNAKVKEIELDFEPQSYIYQVKGYDTEKKYELTINPVDGKVVKGEQSTRDSNVIRDEITLEDVNAIKGIIDQTLEDAGSDCGIAKWSLKSKNNQPIFKVEIVDNNHRDMKYKYNANTGELIEKDQ